MCFHYSTFGLFLIFCLNYLFPVINFQVSLWQNKIRIVETEIRKPNYLRINTSPRHHKGIIERSTKYRYKYTIGYAGKKKVY